MENLLSTPWVVGLGIICIVLLGWWIEVGSERRHLRQSVKEACQAREEFFEALERFGAVDLYLSV